jgi:hypothetical protein
MADIIESTAGVECRWCGVVNWPTALACMGCNATLDKSPRQALASYAGSQPMTYSQKVARFFELTDYLLLVPATYGLAMAMMLVVYAPWFGLSILGGYVAGCFLLRGFFRHSRGRLSDSKTSLLWRATIAYNMIDLFITLFIAESGRNGQTFYLMSLWPLLVIVLSTTALLSENERLRQDATR